MSKYGERIALVRWEAVRGEPATAVEAPVAPVAARLTAVTARTRHRDSPGVSESSHRVADDSTAAGENLADSTIPSAATLPAGHPVRSAEAGRIIPSGRILAVATGVAVGSTALVHVRLAERVADFGLSIDPAHRRRGYGHAALGQLLERAQRADGIDWVRTTVSAEAVSARRLLEAGGFADRGPAWDEVAGLTHTFVRYVG